jgi:glycerophosphoryl diester phosphodiesterase
MKYLMMFSLCLFIGAARGQEKLDLEAHRGGRGIMPENSIPAMLHALDLGITTLELDCVISKDGKVVVSHDVYMSSDFMLKPDGTEISKAEEKQLLLYQMTYAEIKSYDGGTKVHPQFPQQKKMKTYKPLLSELIDSVEEHVKKNHLRPVLYNLEIKSSPKEDNTTHPEPALFVKLVIDVLKRKSVTKRVTIQSFDVRPLQVLKAGYPKQRLSYLIVNKQSFSDNLKTLGFTPDTISPYYTTIDEPFVIAAHEQKVKVLPWTVNDESSIKKMIDLHVDGIITDYPDVLINFVKTNK